MRSLFNLLLKLGNIGRILVRPLFEPENVLRKAKRAFPHPLLSP